MREKYSLAVSRVSDRGNTITRGLGILTQPSDDARAAQLKLGLCLTSVNADGTVTLPIPTVVIVDVGHVLR
jgi:hypothetical protein